MKCCGFIAVLSPGFCEMLARPLAACPDIHRHEEPTLHPLYASYRKGTTKALFRSDRKPVGGHRGKTQTQKCSECYCLNIICHFCLECSNGGLLGEKIGGTKKGMKGPPFRTHSNSSLLGPFTSCVILEVIALVLCLLWRTVAGYQVPGSSESLTIISN